MGVYRGTIWLYLRFVDKQTGEESRKTVSAQLVEIEAVNFLGLSGQFSRARPAVIGSVVGTVIGFPFFEDIRQVPYQAVETKAEISKYMTNITRKIDMLSMTCHLFFMVQFCRL